MDKIDLLPLAERGRLLSPSRRKSNCLSVNQSINQPDVSRGRSHIVPLSAPQPYRRLERGLFRYSAPGDCEPLSICLFCTFIRLESIYVCASVSCAIIAAVDDDVVPDGDFKPRTD